MFEQFSILRDLEQSTFPSYGAYWSNTMLILSDMVHRRCHPCCHPHCHLPPGRAFVGKIVAIFIVI
jgi:hypothetical protein